MTEEEIIFTDEPLKSPGQDILGFAPFAERVADVIIKNKQVKESIVFAVYGKWGAGKTTFLNFITSYLNNQNTITIVNFNPWWFSGKEDLIRQFLHNLKLTLNKSTKLKEIAKALEPYIEAFAEIPKVGWIFKGVSKLKKNSQKSIVEAKEEIIEQLKDIDGKIVIIIDDIDRLTAEEIRELFAIVKVIADFPNTVYILAFDKEVVLRALEKVQEGKGEEYLEKIVQIPIEIPLPDKISIRKMLSEELDTVLSGTPDELLDATRWQNVYWNSIDSFINTVRNVKRLINAIKVIYPSVKGEVNAVDFIAIETLRVFYPEVYSIIKNNPDMFCGYSGVISNISEGVLKKIGISDKALKQFHENWISKLGLSDDIEKSIKNLLEELFPKLKSVFENLHFGSGWEQGWYKKCRVCSREIFPRFFRFSVSSDDIPRSEMESILSSLNNKEDFSKYLRYLATQTRSDGFTKLSVFLERMEDYTSEILQDYIPTVIETFFDIGDEFIIPEDEGKVFSIWGNDIMMLRKVWQLLWRYNDKNNRVEILKNAFEKGQAISIMVEGLELFWQQHGKYGGTKKPDEEILLDEDQLKALQEIVLDKIREAAKKGSLLNTPFLSLVLHKWKDWGDESEVRDWVNKVVASDEKLSIFLAKFLPKTSSMTRWERILNQWKDYIDIDILEKRCNEVLSNNSAITTLDDKQKLAIRQFWEAKHLLDKGKNPDDPFSSDRLEKNDSLSLF